MVSVPNVDVEKPTTCPGSVQLGDVEIMHDDLSRRSKCRVLGRKDRQIDDSHSTFGVIVFWIIQQLPWGCRELINLFSVIHGV